MKAPLTQFYIMCIIYIFVHLFVAYLYGKIIHTDKVFQCHSCQMSLNKCLQKQIKAVILPSILLVQLGINSTRDVWKFCQNWTSRRA